MTRLLRPFAVLLAAHDAATRAVRAAGELARPPDAAAVAAVLRAGRCVASPDDVRAMAAACGLPLADSRRT
jgi:hypothetical protein